MIVVSRHPLWPFVKPVTTLPQRCLWICSKLGFRIIQVVFRRCLALRTCLCRNFTLYFNAILDELSVSKENFDLYFDKSTISRLYQGAHMSNEPGIIQHGFIYELQYFKSINQLFHASKNQSLQRLVSVVSAFLGLEKKIKSLIRPLGPELVGLTALHTRTIIWSVIKRVLGAASKWTGRPLDMTWLAIARNVSGPPLHTVHGGSTTF